MYLKTMKFHVMKTKIARIKSAALVIRENLFKRIHFANLEFLQSSALQDMPKHALQEHLWETCYIHFPPMFLETGQSTLIRNICGKHGRLLKRTIWTAYKIIKF